MFNSDDSMPILEKSFLFGVLRIHGFQVVVKKYVFSITLKKRISQLQKIVYCSNRHTSFQSIVFAIFLFHIVFMNFIDNIRYLREVSRLSLTFSIFTFINILLSFSLKRNLKLGKTIKRFQYEIVFYPNWQWI